MTCCWTGLMVVVGTDEGVKEVEKPQKLVQSSYVYSSKAYFQLWGAQTLPKATPGDGTSWPPGWTNTTNPNQCMQKGECGYPFFGHSITLYARAVRTILNHAPVGEDRARFRPKSHPRARAVNQTLRPELRESQVHRQPNDNRMTLPSPCLGDLVKFLTSNPLAFAFAPREPKLVKDTGNVLPNLSPLFEHKSRRMKLHPCSFGHALLPTSSPALCCLFSLIFFSLLFCAFLFCLFCFVYLLEALNLRSQ